MEENLDRKLDELLERFCSEEHSRQFHQEYQIERVRFIEGQLTKFSDPECQRAYMHGYFDKMKRKNFLNGEYSLEELSHGLLHDPILIDYLIHTAERLGMNREVEEIKKGIERGKEFFDLMPLSVKSSP